MKIGIIGINIYVRAMNYACPLHVYAFQQFLKKHGYSSEVIDYLPNTNKFESGYDFKYPAVYFQHKADAINKKIIALTASNVKDNKELELLKTRHNDAVRRKEAYEAIKNERAERYDKQEKFIKSNLVLSDKQYNCALLEIEDPGYDCYICVTDIIWDKFPATGYEPGFFLGLSCMDNKWKIAYSASKLTAVTPEDKEQTSKWVNDMDFVSVREAFLQRKIMDEIRSDVTCVLDPVLLHDSLFYDRITQKPEENRYLLLYYVVEDAPEIVSEAIAFAKKHDLKIIELTDKITQNTLTKNADIEVDYKYGAGIEEWLGYFKYADYVFTNSFHGCCLSIIFKKTFFVSRRKNYDKITALLDSLELSERIIDDHDISAMSLSINNWDRVNELLEKRRAVSERFLLNALDVAKQQPHPVKDCSIDKMNQQYVMLYNIGKQIKSRDSILPEYLPLSDRFIERTNSIEFKKGKIKNDTSNVFDSCCFKIDGFEFAGYRLRVNFDYQNYYLLEIILFRVFRNGKNHTETA